MITKPECSNDLQDGKVRAVFLKYTALVNALNAKEIPSALSEEINGKIQSLEFKQGADLKKLESTHKEILKLVEKELKLVPKNHHSKLWLTLGMSAFGLPLGIVFSTFFHNYAYIGIGLPLGMAIGVAVGSRLDQQADEQGRQLDIE